METPFKMLFSPFSLGSMELKNRIVMPPMVTNFASDDGYVTEKLKNYYLTRARGGVGLIIVEATCVEGREGKGLKRQLMIDDDRFIPGLEQLVRCVKREGSKIAIQIHHAGSETGSEITGREPVAPSAIAKPGKEMPRELSQSEIKELVHRFAIAAQRAKIAGFDGVEIHGAHGYLIAQFLSSFYNRRSDSYGGDLARRARFLIEIIEETRRLVGKDYPLWCRINGREFGSQGGLTGEEAQEIAKMAQEAGADAIHVSVYAYGVSPRSAPPMAQPPGNLVRFAEAIKRAVTIPVITVGKIDPETGERVLREERADLIAIGRGLIADPYLPNKAFHGRMDEIRPCISCQNCLDSVTALKKPVCCTVNPHLGMEMESEIKRGSSPKKVLVIGGGPAGMEAARVSALRGHEVVLYERKPILGGQMILAAVPPFKKSIEEFSKYQQKQLSITGVKVILNQEATEAIIEGERPDVVFIATGVKPLIPQIPGIHENNVVLAEDVLSRKVTVGKKVAIIGAELVGCETAEFLSDMGKEVTLLRRGEAIATKVNPTVREHLIARLSQKGVKVITGVKYREINKRGIEILTKDGVCETIEADTVVLAAGSVPEIEIYRSIKDKFPNVQVIGDSNKPGNIMGAVSDGFFSALNI